MKKCMICGKPTLDFRSNACDTCFEFLKWKHGKSTYARLREFKAVRNIKADSKIVRRLRWKNNNC